MGTCIKQYVKTLYILESKIRQLSVFKVFEYIILSKQRTTMVLSAPLLFAYGIRHIFA